MKYEYLVILADEDGCPIRFVTPEALEEILSGEEYGDSLNFLTEDDLKQKGKDPNYWSDGEAAPRDMMLVKIAKIVVPTQRVVAWRLDD